MKSRDESRTDEHSTMIRAPQASLEKVVAGFELTEAIINFSVVSKTQFSQVALESIHSQVIALPKQYAKPEILVARVKRRPQVFVRSSSDKELSGSNISRLRRG